jgi:hypothetical protein
VRATFGGANAHSFQIGRPSKCEPVPEGEQPRGGSAQAERAANHHVPAVPGRQHSGRALRHDVRGPSHFGADPWSQDRTEERKATRCAASRAKVRGARTHVQGIHHANLGATSHDSQENDSAAVSLRKRFARAQWRLDADPTPVAEDPSPTGQRRLMMFL